MQEQRDFHEVVLTVDVGGTKTLVSAVGVLNPLHAEMSAVVLGDVKLNMKEGDTTPAGLKARIRVAAEELAHELGLFDRIYSVGGLFAGPMDLDRTLEQMPNTPGWEGVNVLDFLRETFDGWVTMVAGDNDAKGAGLAELWLGAGRQFRNWVYCTHSTGVGGAIFHNGVLYRGLDNKAGEIGHVGAPKRKRRKCGCGMFDCLEAWVSGPSMVLRAQEQISQGRNGAHHFARYLNAIGVSVGDLTAEHVVMAASVGNPYALALLRIVGEELGDAFGSLVMAGNYDGIVVGGGLGYNGAEFLLPAYQTGLDRRTMPGPRARVKIVRADYEQPGAYGAAIGALHAMGYEAAES